MLRRPFALAAVLSLLAAAGAEARTVTYKRIVSPSKQISCHAVIPVAGGGIECSAAYLPDIGELDTYLALRRHGKSILSERGDYSGYTTPRHTLRYGDVWKRPGIRCTMRTSGLTCRNLDSHGFRIARGAIRRF
ncbi:MAG TPA: hypothetical protein VFZ89_04870 [Solirubrobacteraceae bacterium]